MSDGDMQKFRSVVKEEITSALEPVKEKLDAIGEELPPIKEKLDVLWEQTAQVTVDLTEVKQTLEVHSKILRRMAGEDENNSDNIGKLNKRVIAVEDRLGIVSPPEHTIAG